MTARPIAAADPLASLAGRRVLVTGATGFLGAHLCRALGERGAAVHAVSRRPPTHRGDDAPSWQAADLGGGATAVTTVFERAQPDVVFHLTSHGVGSPDLEHVLPTLYGDLVPRSMC